MEVSGKMYYCHWGECFRFDDIMYREPCPSSWLWVGAAVFIIHLSLWLSLLLSLPFPLCLLTGFSPSLCLSLSLRLPLTCLSATVSEPTKRYVCPNVHQGRMSKWGSYCHTRRLPQISMLANWVCPQGVHSLSDFDREASQVLPRQSFPKVNMGQTCTHTHRITRNYNTAPRGLGHPADSILFPLNGSCVTKDNLASLWPDYLRGIWMPPWLTCGLRFLCFVLGMSLPSSLSPPPSLPPSPSLSPFSWSQVVCRGCPGNLAGCPHWQLTPPPPPPPPHPPIPSGRTAWISPY